MGGGRLRWARKAVDGGRGSTMGVVVLVVGVGLLSGCVSCGAGVEVERGNVAQEPVLDTPTGSTPAPGDPSRMPALDLRHGDCYDNISGQDPSGDPTTVYEVIRRDCGEPHQWEVYATFTEDSTTAPASLVDRIREGCNQQFTSFVGVPPDRSGLQLGAVYPPNTTLADTVEVRCVVSDPAGPTTGSLANTAR